LTKKTRPRSKRKFDLSYISLDGGISCLVGGRL
jgi:succinyl-CoA synthetase beta subunit